MADEEREFRIRITGDAGGIVAAGKQGAGALKEVGEESKEAGKQAEHSGVSHRALHAALRLAGEGSKELEIGLSLLSGFMMGSLLFAVQGVTIAVRLLADHFKEQGEKALEAARATLIFWQASLARSGDARKAVEDYADALDKIARGVDALKEKEQKELAVLQAVEKQRLAILDAAEKAELAAAKGDKEEEARIRARYGERKQEIELENEAAEIAHKRQVLEEQTGAARQKAQAASAAERAKEAGAPGREEAMQAERWLESHKDDMVKAQATRMKPEELAALQAEVARRSGEASFMAGPNGPTLTAAGSARQRLESATRAESDYFALQQEWEQMEADVKNFKSGTEKLDKAVKAATEDLAKATSEAESARKALETAQAVHSVNVDAAGRIRGIEAGSQIAGAGVPNNALARNIVGDIGAMEGVAQGQRMSSEQTLGINHLIAGLKAAENNQAAINKLLLEMKDLHLDHAKKIQDIWAALKQVKSQHRDGFNQ